MELTDWYHVTSDDQGVRRRVAPPGRAAWSDGFAWADVIRVCYKAGDLLESDELYVFVRQRPESYLIPLEADGGAELVGACVKHGVLDAEVAIRAASAPPGELLCWPEA